MSIDSSLKLLEYVNKVAKEPIIVDGEPYGHINPVGVKLNDTFFMKDDCQMCGRCCMVETNAWTEEGVRRMKAAVPDDFNKWGLSIEIMGELYTLLEEHVHDINGKKVTFYSVPKIKTKDAMVVSWPDRKPSPRCRWVFEKDGTYRCLIHPVRSVTCGMPHCRFYFSHSTRVTSIGLSQYGRNWALKCPVEFEPHLDEESVKSRMHWLKLLADTADDMGIRTWLPEILHFLESGGRHSHQFFPTRPSLIHRG